MATPASSTVLKAFSVLELFLHRQQIGAVECARRLGIPRASAHRMLVSLRQAGALDATGDGQYRLAWSMFELGQRAQGRQHLYERCYPALESLTATLGFSAHLGILYESSVLYLLKVDRKPGRVQSREGQRAPVHATAMGKALLAGQPSGWVAELLVPPLIALTPYTRTDPQQLLRELVRIRERGLAHEHQESQIGLACVAGTVLVGRVLVAVGVPMPIEAVPHVLGRVEAELDRALAAISRAQAAPA